MKKYTKTGINIIRKGGALPVGTGWILNSIYISDLTYKRLLSFVPDFNSTNDENGVVDQSKALEH